MPEQQDDQTTEATVKKTAKKPEKAIAPAENAVIESGVVEKTTDDAKTAAVATEPVAVAAVKPSSNTPSARPKFDYRRLKQWQVFSLGIAAALILVLIGAGATVLTQNLTNSVQPAITPHQAVANDGNKLTTASEMNISAIASKVSPSVVSIVTQIQSSDSQQDSFFAQPDQSSEAAGSGFIVGSNGIILTNKHVVAGATSVQVMLANGKTYNNVKVLGTDPLNDLAFLQIPNVSNMPVVTLGDSSTLNIGQSVVAIGNSLGQYQNTVTSGIVSGLGRPLTASDDSGDSTETLNGLVQTDAAINPGNSGGPLLNMAGQVIGINTAIAQDAQSIGFAIPINSAKGILKGVLQGKPVERAYLGVRYIPVNVQVQSQYKLATSQGAYVLGSSSEPAVIAGSPAAKAGIQAGDVITKVNGVAVDTANDVSNLVAEYAPGETIQLTLLRGNSTKTVDVTLGIYSGSSSNS